MSTYDGLTVRDMPFLHPSNLQTFTLTYACLLPDDPVSQCLIPNLKKDNDAPA